MLVDSHCHLNYLEDPDDSILRATRSGITSMLCVCVNEETAKDVMELSKRYENVYASLGSHPAALVRSGVACFLFFFYCGTVQFGNDTVDRPSGLST